MNSLLSRKKEISMDWKDFFPDLESGYRAMAEDKEREAEALEWAEVLIEDINEDPEPLKYPW